MLEDYSVTAGRTREIAARSNHDQPGDPRKAAAIILDLEHAAILPTRIQLGEDCFDLVATKLESVAAEQSIWREVSTSTAFDSSR